MPISVTTGAKTGNPVTTEVDLGDSLQDMIDKFGEQVVYDRALRSLKISFQSWVMGQLQAGKSKDEIQKEAKDWKPGNRKRGRTPAERLKDELAKMTPEEQQEFFKQYKAK